MVLHPTRHARRRRARVAVASGGATSLVYRAGGRPVLAGWRATTMRLDLAALVTAFFAVAVSTPPVGVVVHHHAGGELPHVHADLDDDAPHRALHDAASDLDDDHDHPHDEVGEGPGLHVARTAL